jgi:hypothetical protein
MVKIPRGLLPMVLQEVVTGMFFSFVAVALVQWIPSESEPEPWIGLTFVAIGAPFLVYGIKRWRESKLEYTAVHVTLGVCMIFIGTTIAVTPTDLMLSVVLLLFLAMICLALVAAIVGLIGWLKRLLT